MATVNFPVISKTLTETLLKFSFITENENGDLSREPQPDRKYDTRKTHNALTRELQREFPDKIVKVDSVEEIKSKYTMSIDDFLKYATLEPTQQELESQE